VTSGLTENTAGVLAEGAAARRYHHRNSEYSKMTKTQTNMAVLFADISDSTELFGAVGDSAAHQIVQAWLEQVTALLPNFAGRLVKTMGDEAMCVFPDADQAVLAASAMQANVTSNPPQGHAIKLHMGLHFGEVMFEDDDIFGNTVNIAAYLTAVALPQQIAITHSTYTMLSAPLKTVTRPVFRTVLKGQTIASTIYQVLWKNENPDLTHSFFSIRQAPLLPSDNGGLLLKYMDQVIHLNHLRPKICLGRDIGCDIVIDDRYASREHATIELDGWSFYLVDHSINGTYITFDNRQEVSVMRRDVLLDGGGKISLGRAFQEDPKHVIEFSYDWRSLFRV
jgi:class 3 adenylate cyclase